MKNLKRYLVLFIILHLAVLFILPSCKTGIIPGEEVTGDKQEEKSPESLTITYQGKDTVVSIEEIMELDEVEKDITPVPKEGEEKGARSVKGVLLDDIFQKFLGISQQEPHAIRLIAGDGYSIEVSKDLLQTRDIILAYEIDGKPLEGWEKPLRSVVPDVFEMYWVKNLVKIEVIQSRQQTQIVRIIMIETRISDIPDVGYTYLDETDRAVKVSDLLFSFNEDMMPDTVSAKSIDGLEKTEKVGIFKNAFIKYTGQDSPMFISDDIPKGMWIKRILYFIYGGSAYFSVNSGFEAIQKETIEENDSIKLTDIFSTCGIEASDKYLFKSLDDYSVEIEAGSIDLGYVYIQKNGLPAVYFKGLPKNTNVKDLIYIGISE